MVMMNRAWARRGVSDQPSAETSFETSVETSAVPVIPESRERRARVERAYDRRPLLLSGVQLVFLVASACLLVSLMAGAMLLGVLVQLGSLGH
jgi:hypothetical protein